MLSFAKTSTEESSSHLQLRTRFWRDLLSVRTLLREQLVGEMSCNRHQQLEFNTVQRSGLYRTVKSKWIWVYQFEFRFIFSTTSVFQLSTCPINFSEPSKVHLSTLTLVTSKFCPKPSETSLYLSYRFWAILSKLTQFYLSLWSKLGYLKMRI